MKVVINACNGSFSLSPKAIKYIAEKNNQKVYFFSVEWGKDFDKPVYVPISLERATKEWFHIRAFTVENPNLLTDEERKNASWEEYKYSSNRSDPLLIEVVEVLREQASGLGAELKIVEIPDGIEWKLQEYDGLEWVAEKHRTWH